MKKIIFLLMVVFLTVPAFAEEEWDGNRQMAITMNPVPLIGGLILGGFGINVGFEFAPIPTASVKANIYYVGFDPVKFVDGNTQGKSNASLFRANLEGRWYPSGNYVSGWFLNG
jgi:hypothetical protein